MYDDYRTGQLSADKSAYQSYEGIPYEPPSYAIAVGAPQHHNGDRDYAMAVPQRQYTSALEPPDAFEETQHFARGGAQSSAHAFRPLALPQIAYGDGQPFIRGYNDQLEWHGISQTEFIRIVDAINVAIVPNPENQIFQKGANIAGWFV